MTTEYAYTYVSSEPWLFYKKPQNTPIINKRIDITLLSNWTQPYTAVLVPELCIQIFLVSKCETPDIQIWNLCVHIHVQISFHSTHQDFSCCDCPCEIHEVQQITISYLFEETDICFSKTRLLGTWCGFNIQ